MRIQLMWNNKFWIKTPHFRKLPRKFGWEKSTGTQRRIDWAISYLFWIKLRLTGASSRPESSRNYKSSSLRCTRVFVRRITPGLVNTQPGGADWQERYRHLSRCRSEQTASITGRKKRLQPWLRSDCHVGKHKYTELGGILSKVVRVMRRRVNEKKEANIDKRPHTHTHSVNFPRGIARILGPNLHHKYLGWQRAHGE